MIKEIGHIFDHFDFGTFPDGENSKEKIGTRFTSDDLVIFYEDFAISFNQFWRIINSKKDNKITFSDLKKGW